MLTARQAREQKKDMTKEFLDNDLSYIEKQILYAIKEEDETFVSIGDEYLHKEVSTELVEALSNFGYTVHETGSGLLVQWGKPDTREYAAVPEEDKDYKEECSGVGCELCKCDELVDEDAPPFDEDWEKDQSFNGDDDDTPF
jgi:hypothetical protein